MKRALISVFYKENIEIVAGKLNKHGWEIISTGGTANHLEAHGIPVTRISSITRFPEMLDGRVKTLHPLVFGPILAKSEPSHLKQLEEFSVPKIELVMVNFYPFEEALTMKSDPLSQMVEKIDIGGPSMVRAAAKNFSDTVVVVDQADYEPVVESLVTDGTLPFEKKQALAARAFSYTAYYDSLIARYLTDLDDVTPGYLGICGRKSMDLRYGENPHQRAALYTFDQTSPLLRMEKIQGKKLSYNNILDLSMVYEVINRFGEQKDFCVIVKHQNPCGAAMADNQAEAFRQALAGDPKSAFGGIVGFNHPLSLPGAEKIKDIFFEVIIAPDFTPEALELLKKKKKLRLVKIPLHYQERADLKIVPGGFVFQEKDNLECDPEEFELKTGRTPTQREKGDVQFGWKLIKFVKSNGIIIVKDQQLIGVGAGQMSRVDAVELAIKKSQFPLEGSVLLSDAFFPFPDSIEIAAGHKIGVVVEPGGSIRDQEVIDKAAENNITLLFTGIRHFRH